MRCPDLGVIEGRSRLASLLGRCGSLPAVERGEYQPLGGRHGWRAATGWSLTAHLSLALRCSVACSRPSVLLPMAGSAADAGRASSRGAASSARDALQASRGCQQACERDTAAFRTTAPLPPLACQKTLTCAGARLLPASGRGMPACCSCPWPACRCASSWLPWCERARLSRRDKCQPCRSGLLWPAAELELQAGVACPRRERTALCEGSAL